MLNIEIYIPLADNDGAPFAVETVASFEVFLAGTFGGFSKLPGTIEGVWMGESGSTGTTSCRTWWRCPR